MLVRVANESGLSGAEHAVVGWIRSWQSTAPLPGLAVVNCRVPTRNGYRQVDAIVWTPHGCVVLEIKGFRTPQSGTLRVPVNAAWTVAGRPADLYTLRSNTNPLDQLEANCYAVKNRVVASGVAGAFVHGVVLVMPSSPAEIALARVEPPVRTADRPDRLELRRGIDVLVGSDDSLRRFLDGLGGAGRPAKWSASMMVSAFEALGLPDVPDAAELVREGFPDDLLRVPDIAALPSVAQLPPRSMPSSMVASALAARASGPAPRPVQAWGVTPPAAPRRRTGRRLLRILMWLGIAVGVLWLIGAAVTLLSFLSAGTTATAGHMRFLAASGEVACEIVAPGDGSSAPRATCTTTAAAGGEPCDPGTAMTVTTWTGWGPEVRCGAATAVPGGRLLTPGETVTLGSIDCTGYGAGITCVDRSGRGFVLDVGRYRALP